MSKFACTCGHVTRDQTDFLPYKGHIREDEDTQKPIELVADLLAQFMEAHQRGEDAAFIRQFERAQGNQTTADWQVKYLADKPLSATIFHPIFDFWNSNHERGAHPQA